jgi:hypothetical protein
MATVDNGMPPSKTEARCFFVMGNIHTRTMPSDDDAMEVQLRVPAENCGVQSTPPSVDVPRRPPYTTPARFCA